MKKTLSALGILSLSILTLTGCSSSSSSTTSDSSDPCYIQCEKWGGDALDVAMCKENCDASNDKNSVWNVDEEDYNDELSGSWPSDMPSQVPTFTYGEIAENVSGMSSWIVDFYEVGSDALESYKADLEAAGWTASIMSITNTLNGKLAGKYTIQVMYDPEYKTAQIMVRKSSN